MLYAITHGQVSREAARTEEIMYLITSTQALRGAGLAIVASNRHAELEYADLTDADEALDRDDFVDWDLMRARYWSNTPDDPDRKERRQAVCLVHPGVPWDLIEEVVTKTAEGRDRVAAALAERGSAARAFVERDWYF